MSATKTAAAGRSGDGQRVQEESVSLSLPLSPTESNPICVPDAPDFSMDLFRLPSQQGAGRRAGKEQSLEKHKLTSTNRLE